MTYTQARSCGLTDPQIRHRLRNGSLERVGLAGAAARRRAVDLGAELMAGLLDLGDSAVVSRRAAAALTASTVPARAVEFTISRAGRE